MTSDELARAFKEDEITLEVALEAHLRNLGSWPADEELLGVLWLALGFANLGMEDRPVPMSGDRRLTVGEVIEHYRLRPFLERLPGDEA